ncbi:MAG: phenylalanine--tRNA ligase subunit beta [bacterium]
MIIHINTVKTLQAFLVGKKMKLSLAWIFDHIDAKWQDHDINHIMATFNRTTAEIEKFYPISFNLDNFYLAQLSTRQSTTALIPELNKEVAMPKRSGTVDVIPAQTISPVFMIKKIEDRFVWASLADFGVEKDGLIPALDAAKQDLSGAWREKFERTDIILEVDNKSITHRPDMWGHRGFAREIAAFLNLPLIKKEKFLAKQKQLSFDTQSTSTETNPFVIENRVPEICTVFNGLYFKSIENKPSNIFITSRLLKVEARPITGIVDLTNYVTLDWSQPVHAYDAAKIEDKKVIIRLAKEKEKLLLLEGNELELTLQDMLIADGKKGMCLAGVKGGLHDSVNPNTTSIFFESANFNAAAVRRAAFRHATRSDSSARFEKTLDPNQAIEGILRFLSLTKQCGIKTIYADHIITVGKTTSPITISVTHDYLESHAGCYLTSDDIKQLLSRIEFNVKIESKKPLTYAITVPTFRATKDVQHKEDILEEVIRLHGFEKITLELPRMPLAPSNLTPTMRMKKIKNFFAYNVQMMEQQNYALCDEQSLTHMGISVNHVVKIVNPVSENYHRLVTSLVPGLLKNIKDNCPNHESLRFFESARIWIEHSNDVAEKKSIAGIIFEKRKKIDFYAGKQYIFELLKALEFDQSSFVWEKIEKSRQSWYMPYQSAYLIYNDKKIGQLGKIDPSLLPKLDALPESDAFIFELDGDFLLQATIAEKQFKPFSRFQETFFDVSLLVPLTLTTKALEISLKNVSKMITKVALIDFFEKEEWTENRSLTFRVWLSSQEKTLERDNIETVRLAAIKATQTQGAKLRS